MKKAKIINLINQKIREEKERSNEENTNEKKVIFYFKYDKEDQIFIGLDCCLFCLDKNLIPIGRSKCVKLSDQIKEKIIIEAEDEYKDLLTLTKIDIIKDSTRKLCVFKLKEEIKGFENNFYLNKMYCDIFSDSAEYKVRLNKVSPDSEYVYIFEKEKFVGLILQIKRN